MAAANRVIKTPLERMELMKILPFNVPLSRVSLLEHLNPETVEQNPVDAGKSSGSASAERASREGGKARRGAERSMREEEEAEEESRGRGWTRNRNLVAAARGPSPEEDDGDDDDDDDGEEGANGATRRGKRGEILAPPEGVLSVRQMREARGRGPVFSDRRAAGRAASLRAHDELREELRVKLARFSDIHAMEKDDHALLALLTRLLGMQEALEGMDWLRSSRPEFARPLVFEWNNGMCRRLPRDRPERHDDANQSEAREWSNVEVHERAMWTANLGLCLERCVRFAGMIEVADGGDPEYFFLGSAMRFYARALEIQAEWRHAEDEPPEFVPFGCDFLYVHLLRASLRCRDALRELEAARAALGTGDESSHLWDIKAHLRIASFHLRLHGLLEELGRLCDAFCKGYDARGCWKDERLRSKESADEHYVLAHYHKAKSLVHPDHRPSEYERNHCAAWSILQTAARGRPVKSMGDTHRRVENCLASIKSYLGRAPETDSQAENLHLEAAKLRLDDASLGTSDLGRLRRMADALVDKHTV